MSNAAVFFDRDGTLIHDPGYLNHPDQVQVLDGVAEALKEFQLLGYKTVVVSNQSAVARGVVTVEMLERIHDRLRELLALKGASLDAIYYCPYHPEGTVPEYRQDSDWRKPQPGMLLAAAREMDLDLSRSWMIGDNDRDVEAGRSAGCKTIRIGSKPAGNVAPGETRQPVRADYIAVNIREAVNIVKREHRRAPHEKREDKRMSLLSETRDDPNLAVPPAEVVSMAPEPAAEEPLPHGSKPQGQETPKEPDKPEAAGPRDDRIVEHEVVAQLVTPDVERPPKQASPPLDEPPATGPVPHDPSPSSLTTPASPPTGWQAPAQPRAGRPEEREATPSQGPAIPKAFGLEAATRKVPASSPPVTPATAQAETEHLLKSILEQLRRMQKNESFGEFSLMRLLAGIVQVFVPFCLLLALWFVMGSERRDNSVLVALGFAAVLQLMALTFYIMHDRR
jgi:D-glycero-D-manno-heptose 1,7-bisphosphate phosphatase